ncbi:MAG: PKD domain-containing protein [Planctomycetota bacterium]|nr:PKD domain-containing protein [Planctomycetota bacterium]
MRFETPNHPVRPLLPVSQSALVLFVLLLLTPGSADGQFTEIIPISDVMVPVSGVYLHVDQNCLSCSPQQVSITARGDNDIYFTGSVLDFQQMFSVLTSTGQVFSPALTQGAVASYSISLEQEFPGEPRSVYLIDSVAAGFGDPVLISSGINESFDSSVVVLNSGDRVITWTRTGSSSNELMMKFSDQAPILCGAGSNSKALAVSEDSAVIVWQQGTVLKAMITDASSQGAVFDLYNLLSPIEEWDAAVQSDGSIQLAVDVSDELHLLTGSIFGGIATQQIVSTSTAAITDVAIGSLDSDRHTVAWIQNQQVHRYVVNGTASPVSGPIEQIPGNHTEFDMSYDGPGNEHFVIISDGVAWYAHDTPPPEADFSISTEDDGIADHTIMFDDQSGGLVDSYLWDFGDGGTSTNSLGEHTYVEPGFYAVSLTVSGPGGSDTKVVNNAVVVGSPDNSYKLADISVFSGQPVIHPVLGSHQDALQGYQISITYDETVLTMTEISLEGTLADALQPEFIATSINPGGVNSSLYLAVIFDTLPPFDGRTMAPGVDQTLCTLNYTVLQGTPLGTSTELRFADDLVSPPINNIYATDGGTSVIPYWIHGTVTVSEQPQFLFIRGDATYDQTVNIADAIFLLNFLFTGGDASVCPDAGDTNDDGSINIGDPINLLNFLFTSGSTIPYPYPGYGIDPTPDSLGACLP